jgi:DtxR family Mn-dependent transcriptional regulator
MATNQTPSMEDYLESMVMLQAGNKPVTVTEISRMMGVKMPSVVYALSKLSEQNLVEYKKRSPIKLTRRGKRLGADVFRRHEALYRFLTEILGVNPGIATKDACKMEHFLSPVSLKRLNKFLGFVLECPRGRPEWLEGLAYYFEKGKRSEEMLAKCQRVG